MNFDLDNIDEIMDFVAYIFTKGQKVKEEKNQSIVGYWQWEHYRVILFGSGDVTLMDDKNENGIQIFFSDREKNLEEMRTKGQIHRTYMIRELLKSDNLVKLEKIQADPLN